MHIDLPQLTLSAEQSSAITAAVDARNEANGTAITVPEHLGEIVMAEIIRVTAAAYAASVAELAAGAAMLPYEARLQVTALTREKITEFLTTP